MWEYRGGFYDLSYISSYIYMDFDVGLMDFIWVFGYLSYFFLEFEVQVR